MLELGSGHCAVDRLRPGSRPHRKTLAASTRLLRRQWHSVQRRALRPCVGQASFCAEPRSHRFSGRLYARERPAGVHLRELRQGQWGEEVLRRVAVGMFKKEASPPAPTEDDDWLRQQADGGGNAGARVVRRGAESSATTDRSAQTLHHFGPGGPAKGRCARVQLAKRPAYKESASAR